MSCSGVLLPYQTKWVTNNAKYSVYSKSRRIGITYAEALWSVRRRLTVKEDHFFVSYKEQTAQEFLGYVKLWCEVLNTATKETHVNIKGATNSLVTMPNGSRIVAMTSASEALRGMGGSVTLDEFDFVPDPEALIKAATPVLDWGGCLRIISTHQGVGTPFWNICERAKAGENGYQYFRTTLIDAVNDGLALKQPGEHRKLLPDVAACNAAFIAEKRRAAYSDDGFRQEYLCEVNASTTILSAEEYDGCVLPDYDVPDHLDEARPYGPLYVGADIGRTRNLTVIWVLERGFDKEAPPHQQDVYRTVCMREIDNETFQSQYQQLDKIIGHKRVYGACIDAGGIGMQLAEDLARQHGNRVQKVHIGAQRKAELVERVKKYVAQKRVSLPNDDTTKADLLSMKRNITRAGNLTYDGNSGDSHCDRYIALSLALEAAENAVRLSAMNNFGGVVNGS